MSATEMKGHTGTALSEGACASMGVEARKVLTILIENSELNMPASVTDFASTVSFTPDVNTFLPTPLRMSESASALWACVGLFADAICRERFGAGKPEKIIVDVYSATLMLCSVFFFEVEGKHFMFSKAAPRAAHLDKGHMHETFRSMASNIYKTADGRYFHLHGSLNATPSINMLGLPLHRPDLQGIEHIAASKDIYRAAIAARDSVSLDAEANERWRMPGAICLTVDEFAATPHGKLNVKDPLYKIHKINEQLPPTPWPRSTSTTRPLAGLKVLDLTKVIAGPTVTRVLALQGADVLRISTGTQPDAISFIGDGQVGKRDTDINLKTEEGKLLLDKLLEEADVVVCSYRAHAFERMGLGRNWAHELARRRAKGIVYCQENCYGWNGEWSHRAGYQPISDAVTGASWEQGRYLGLEEPVMPLFPNSDSQTGVSGAIAVMQALLRRSTEGGSYNIEVSLNQYNNFLLRKVGFHDKQTQASLRALHPDFLPRHDTSFFELVPMVLQTLKQSHGNGTGELWDRTRFTKGVIRWGKEGEEADFLDWRRIVSVEGEAGKEDVVFGFATGSCMPGCDEAKFLPTEQSSS